MTAQQKIKWLIIEVARGWGQELPPITDGNVDAIYADQDGTDGALGDAREAVRCSGEETGIGAPLSRHYEAESIAQQCPDGSWVGWTYWHGGGKHGEPESIDWISDAYDLAVTEKQVTVTQRTFAKA